MPSSFLGHRQNPTYAVILPLLFAALALALVHTRGRLTALVEQRIHSRVIDETSIDVWLDFMQTHKPEAMDRAGLSSMGFATFVLAETIRRNDQLTSASIMESLFSFCPGAQLLVDSIQDDRQLRVKDWAPNWYTSFSSVRSERRGIVISAHKSSLVAITKLVRVLREELRSTLPIEILYYAPSSVCALEDLSTSFSGVTASNMVLREVFNEDDFDMEPDNYWSREVQKSLALLSTRFGEVIYLDPSVIPLRDPAILLESSSYKSTGSAFFRAPTFVTQIDAHPIISLLHSQKEGERISSELSTSAYWQSERGSYVDNSVMAFSRTKPGIFSALLLNAWLHTRRNRMQIWQAKHPLAIAESLWIAFELARIPYSFVEEGVPGAIGSYDGDVADTILDVTICNAKALHFMSDWQDMPMYLGNAWPMKTENTSDNHTFLGPNATFGRHARWQDIRECALITGQPKRFLLTYKLHHKL